MKLLKILEIGEQLGLQNLDQALCNIERSWNLFPQEELEEVYADPAWDKLNVKDDPRTFDQISIHEAKGLIKR
jgi:hypothetical protein